MRSNKGILQKIIILMFFISLSGCVGKSDGQNPTETIQISDAMLKDAEMMASEMGISLNESVKRLSLQEAIGTLDANLSDQEADTFAGLWIEYEPEYRVVASFTRNGKATIRPYIKGTALQELVDVETAKRSLKELKLLQREITKISDEMGLSISSGINIPGNQVEIYITDQKLWEAKLVEHNQQVPDGIKTIVIYKPLAENAIPAITPAPNIFIPQLRVRSSEFMTALLEGNLEIINTCPRIVTEYDTSGWLIIWQPDYFVNDNHGIIEILDRDGQVVAQESEHIRMGGGEIPISSFSGELLREPIPDQCKGPYWLMGDLAIDE